jgi:DNA polymerase-3 subunit epsilon
MKLNDNQKEWITRLSELGFSSREISERTGVSKSAINYYLNGRTYESKSPKKSPRILALDLETSADVVATFGRYNTNISESNIIHQGNAIVSAAWSFIDEEKVHVQNSKFKDFKIEPLSELTLLVKLLNAIEQADAVVIHNARFDLGTIQHRMLQYNLGKLPAVKVIDTLHIARKYLKLRSNKLDSITKYFNLSNKMQNEGISLWIQAQSGDKEAMKKMKEYNQQDVVALKAVYNLFVPLVSTVNQGLFTEDAVCPSCGSSHVEKTGRQVHTTVNSFDEYICLDCGSRMRSRKSNQPKSKLQTMLVPLG